jgi:hypothetical protein
MHLEHRTHQLVVGLFQETSYGVLVPQHYTVQRYFELCKTALQSRSQCFVQLRPELHTLEKTAHVLICWKQKRFTNMFMYTVCNAEVMWCKI